MIHVTRLHGEDIIINAALIEFIESTPDTMISLTTGRKVMVRESVDEVIDRAIAYHRALHAPTHFARPSTAALAAEVES